MKSLFFCLGVVIEIIIMVNDVKFLSDGMSGLDYAFAIVTGIVFVISSIVLFTKVVDGWTTKNNKYSTIAMFLALWLVSLASSTYNYYSTGINDGGYGVAKVAYEESVVELNKAQELLSLCDTKLVTLCVKPRTNDVVAIQAKVDAAKLAVSKFEKFVSKKEAREEWAKNTGISANNLTILWGFVRAVLINLLPFFCFFYAREKQTTTTQLTIPQPEKKL